MKSKSELGTSASDPTLDKVLANGMTRRQILDKVLSDPKPGLRGDAKWAALQKAAQDNRQ
jgi:hypothetical protein